MAKKKRTAAKRGAVKKASARRSKPAAKPAKRTAAKSRAVKSSAAKSRAVKKRGAKAKTPPRKSALRSAAESVGRAVTGTVAAVAAQVPWTGSGTDAIELLEQDHRRLEDLLARGEKTTARGVKSRTDLLKTITIEIAAHELIEEKLLYPALKAHPEGKDVVLEGYQEHHVADLLLKELHAMARSDERWGAKFKVLKENLEHHIKEEEGLMFCIARGVFSRDELQALGARMRELYPEGEAAEALA